jgi:hypothetical protein
VATGKAPRDDDRDLYAARHLIKHFFGKRKQFGGIATRSNKTRCSSLTSVHLAASAILLN